MQEYKIEVQKRELSNKKSTINQLRQNNEIPGIYYSHDSKLSIPFSVDVKILFNALKSDVQVYKINVGGKNRDVIIKSIQYHPVSESILHIDLYGVRMDQKVTLKVPILFIGQSEGVRSGGVLNQNLTELEVSCLPTNIPQNIEVDVTDLNIGDGIRLEQISVNENVELIGDSDLLITSVTLPTKIEEPEILEEEIDELSEEETSDTSDESSESEKDKTDVETNEDKAE